MLLKKFKSNHTFNFVLFPILGVLFWLKDLLFPTAYSFYPEETQNVLYAPVQKMLQESVFLQNVVALLLFLLLAFLALQINNRYNFIRIRTMLPVTLFVLMAGGFSGLHALHPVYFGAVFFLIALYRLLSAYDHPKPYAAAFDSGFFMGIACLFYLNLLSLLPAFLIGIGILSRESRWREFFILLIGFLLPFAFGASYFFVIDRLPEMITVFKANLLTPNDRLPGNLPLQMYTGFLLVLTLFGSLKLIKEYDTKKVSSRKYFMVFFLIFLCSVAAILFIPAVSQEMLLISIVPVTFLTTNFFVFLKSRFWGELLFMLLFLVVISMQIIS